MAYQSPYFGTNVGGGWGVFPGVADMLARDWQASKEGFNTLGALGGALGGGVVGGFQGAADPTTLGKETKAGGAFQGFMTNLNAGLNGGGMDMGSFTGQGGGAGRAGNMNVKQLQLAGKASDSMWKAMAEGQLLQQGQEPSAFGVSKTKWDTLGSLDKMAIVGGAMQANAEKTVLAKLAEYATLMERQKAETASINSDVTANRGFQNSVMAGQLARGGGAPVRPTFEDVQAAAFANPTAPAAAGILQQAARGIEGNFFQPSAKTEAVTPGYLRVPTGPNTSVIVADPTNAGKATAIVGPNGEPLGFGLPGRSGLNPLPKSQVDARQRSYQQELTAALDAEAKAWQTLQAARPNASNWDALNNSYNAAASRRKRAEAKLMPAAKAPGALAKVPPEHAAYLKAHPEKRASFEATYGKAAAAAILGD